MIVLQIYLMLLFFNGETVLKPYDLSEADIDVSFLPKFNGHAVTVQKFWM